MHDDYDYYGEDLEEGSWDVRLPGGDGTTSGGGGGDYDYADVLGKSILFYEAQRSGYYRVCLCCQWTKELIFIHREGFHGGVILPQETEVTWSPLHLISTFILKYFSVIPIWFDDMWTPILIHRPWRRRFGGRLLRCRRQSQGLLVGNLHGYIDWMSEVWYWTLLTRIQMVNFKLHETSDNLR